MTGLTLSCSHAGQVLPVVEAAQPVEPATHSSASPDPAVVAQLVDEARRISTGVIGSMPIEGFAELRELDGSMPSPYQLVDAPDETDRNERARRAAHEIVSRVQANLNIQQSMLASERSLNVVEALLRHPDAISRQDANAISNCVDLSLILLWHALNAEDTDGALQRIGLVRAAITLNRLSAIHQDGWVMQRQQARLARALEWLEVGLSQRCFNLTEATNLQAVLCTIAQMSFDREFIQGERVRAADLVRSRYFDESSDDFDPDGGRVAEKALEQYYQAVEAFFRLPSIAREKALRDSTNSDRVDFEKMVGSATADRLPELNLNLLVSLTNDRIQTQAAGIAGSIAIARFVIANGRDPKSIGEVESLMYCSARDRMCNEPFVLRYRRDATAETLLFYAKGGAATDNGGAMPADATRRVAALVLDWDRKHEFDWVPLSVHLRD